MLHELDLQVLVSLIMIGKQVVDAFKKSGQSAAVVFFLEQEFFLRECLNEVNETVACLSTKLLRVGGQVGDHGYYRLVDRFEKAWARLYQLVDGEEDEIVIRY